MYGEVGERYPGSSHLFNWKRLKEITILITSSSADLSNPLPPTPKK
jgi:hypothetical protein